MILRKGEIADIPEIASILVHSWKKHYRHFLPAPFLEKLSLAHQIKRHRAYMQGEAQYFVAVDPAGTIMGFASFGKSRGEELQTDCELYTIYVKDDYIGLGIGYQLLIEVLKKAKQSYQTIGVWVMEGNPFLSFYERNGFKLQGEDFMLIEEVKIKNLKYVMRLS